MNAANVTWWRRYDGAVHKAAEPGLLAECQKVNGCKIGECKVTSNNKLTANYVFHAVGLRGKNENKLEDCYESCLQKVSVYDVKSIEFCCI